MRFTPFVSNPRSEPLIISLIVQYVKRRTTFVLSVVAQELLLSSLVVELGLQSTSYTTIMTRGTSSVLVLMRLYSTDSESQVRAFCDVEDRK